MTPGPVISYFCVCSGRGYKSTRGGKRPPGVSCFPANTMKSLRVLYAAFDAYPGFKGAQAHMRANLRALAAGGGQATLLCLGPGGSFQDPDSGAAVHAFAAREPNMLRRTELFGRFLAEKADTMRAHPPDIVHFRDIWSGRPLLSSGLSSRFVFEVNGLPSVELPGRYPGLAANPSLLARLRSMEDECLARADRIIAVCRRTARYLEDRGCEKEKIAVIPNAADPPRDSKAVQGRRTSPEKDAAGDEKLILYAGTTAPWQGLAVLLEALTHLRHRSDFSLVVVASNKKGVSRLRQQARAGGLPERVSFLYGVHPHLMSGFYRRAYLSVAPLARGARNELQGCCPVKIVESMAAGTPVVASDLPVVRELISPGIDGVLVPPGSARALAKALDALLDDGSLRDRLAREACEKARRDFGTGLFRERLHAVYNSLTGEEESEESYGRSAGLV